MKFQLLFQVTDMRLIQYPLSLYQATNKSLHMHQNRVKGCGVMTNETVIEELNTLLNLFS